jgi:hypothetical protein
MLDTGSSAELCPVVTSTPYAIPFPGSVQVSTQQRDGSSSTASRCRCGDGGGHLMWAIPGACQPSIQGALSLGFPSLLTWDDMGHMGWPAM